MIFLFFRFALKKNISNTPSHFTKRNHVHLELDTKAQTRVQSKRTGPSALRTILFKSFTGLTVKEFDDIMTRR